MMRKRTDNFFNDIYGIKQGSGGTTAECAENFQGKQEWPGNP
ncbi:hypothetical protein B0I18_1093 [Taibaiella chishuiensis]|uniref:Uncharacterized protein n=1 Tax=Taibaiella chishuiensis TaxID=1434707 RepID=A0A2P8CYF3_9BACT|nr:hypothetical protein B0I18_1093 [Taibaiella chishuiensis]